MTLQIIPRVRETNFNLEDLEHKIKYTDGLEKYKDELIHIKEVVNRKDKWNGVGGLQSFAEFVFYEQL